MSLRRRKMEPEAECRCGGAGCHSGGFLLRIMPPSWQPVPACARNGHSAGGPFNTATTGFRRRNHSSLPQPRLESGAGRCRGWDRRHSGGFLLRIMPPSWHPVPACSPRLRCRRVILLCSNDGAASIPKFGPEFKNRCTQEGGIGEKLASIPKSGLEIKNRCSLWAVLEGFFASIPKSGLEIKNQCTQEGVTAGFTRARRVSALQKKEPLTCVRGSLRCGRDSNSRPPA